MLSAGFEPATFAWHMYRPFSISTTLYQLSYESRDRIGRDAALFAPTGNRTRVKRLETSDSTIKLWALMCYLLQGIVPILSRTATGRLARCPILPKPGIEPGPKG